MERIVPASLDYDSEEVSMNPRASAFLVSEPTPKGFVVSLVIVDSAEHRQARIPFRSLLPSCTRPIPHGVAVQVFTGDIDEVVFYFQVIVGADDHEEMGFEAATSFGALEGLIEDTLVFHSSSEPDESEWGDMVHART